MDFKKSLEELDLQVFLLRQQNEMSINELAFKIHKHRSKVEKLELGTIDFDIGTIKKVAKVFNKKININMVD